MWAGLLHRLRLAWCVRGAIVCGSVINLHAPPRFLQFKNVKQMGQRPQGSFQQSFVERSRFLRHDGRWLYVDGEQDWKK